MYKNSQYYLNFLNNLNGDFEAPNPLKNFCSIYDVKVHEANESEEEIVIKNKKQELRKFPIFFFMLGMLVIFMFLGIGNNPVGLIIISVIGIPIILLLIKAIREFKTKAYSKFAYGVVYSTNRIVHRSKNGNSSSYETIIYFPDIQKYVGDVTISSFQYKILRSGMHVSAYVSRGVLNIVAL